MNLQLGKLSKLSMDSIDERNRKETERAAAAQQRVADAHTVTEEDWVRIMGMKNSKPDQERLTRLKDAMDTGLIERDPADAVNAKGVVKNFSKAEAMRLFTKLVEIERVDTLKQLVEDTPDNYVLVLDYDRLREVVAESLAEPIVALDTETTGVDTYVDVIVGMSITNPNADKHYYIPVKPTEDDRALDPEIVFEIVQPLIESDIKKVYHNANFDIKMFQRHGLRPAGLYWDTMPAMALLNENEPSYALKNLVTKYLKEPSDKYDELFGKNAPFAKVPLDVALAYGAKDTDITWRMYEFQRMHLEKMPTVLEYLLTVEVPLIEAIIRMEQTGFDIDRKYAKDYGKKMLADIIALETELKATLDINRPDQDVIEVGDTVAWMHHDRGETSAIVLSETSNTISVKAVVGEEPYPDEQGIVDIPRMSAYIVEKRHHEPINLNSHVQVKAALEYVTGQRLESTDAKKVLKPLAGQFPVIAKLLKYKELSKLYGTYISVLPEKIHPVTGKLHARFNPNGTVTGRFSSGGNGVNLKMWAA